jgi:hypothetical protein
VAKQLPILGVGLTEVTKALERVPAKARFVVIDACRNVAFSKGLKDAAKGFVPERKLEAMIVAFATRPGETAEDNNVYASALASILPTPGLHAEEVFKETQLKVADQTRGTQIPWTEDGLLTRFTFKEAMSNATPSVAQRAESKSTEAAEAWAAIRDATNAAPLEAFIRRYGDTLYGDLARLKLDALKTATHVGEVATASLQHLTVPQQPTAAPTCPNGTIWRHNGSELRLVADGRKRSFYYLAPRSGLTQVGIKEGTLLFSGERVGDRYEGTARRFSEKLPSPRI